MYTRAIGIGNSIHRGLSRGVLALQLQVTYLCYRSVRLRRAVVSALSRAAHTARQPIYCSGVFNRKLKTWRIFDRLTRV